MIILYLLLVLAVSVHGNQDLQEVCPYEACFPKNPPKLSDKPVPKLKIIFLQHGSDLDMIKVTPNLEVLYVYNCSSDFTMGIFPPLAALRQIEITNCSISELQSHQFENVVNLDSLKMEKTGIEILSNETFHKLSHLRFLYLQNNLIQDLPEEVFNPLKSLYILNLNNNNISTLPKDIFMRNLELQSISLSGNPLKIVRLDFPIWTYAEIVYLNFNDCGELKDLQLSIRLGDLYLKNSGVERLQITGSIRDIHHENSKVTRADLSGNYFGRPFVETLCDMPSLEWLDLSNSSKFFDYSFFEVNENERKCKFSNLRSVNLSGNKLNYIPRRLPLFGPNLTTLDLSHNVLEDDSLNDLFHLDTPKTEEGHFPNLMFLHMAYNKLTKIPENCPLFGPNLAVLDLSHNLLRHVSLEALAKAHNLQSLYLEGNRLTSFDYLSVCDGLKNLKHLAIYDNAFNATFYRNMTKYFGDNDLRLTQTENRGNIEAENQDNNDA